MNWKQLAIVLCLTTSAAYAQYAPASDPFGSVPSAGFQSTDAFRSTSCGMSATCSSSYSAHVSALSDGGILEGPAHYYETTADYGPRRIGIGGPSGPGGTGDLDDDDPMPVGDGVVFLLVLCALAGIALRKRVE